MPITWHISHNVGKDNSLCGFNNPKVLSFLLPIQQSFCLWYNKYLPLNYCNSNVTIDLAGSFTFIVPLLIFTSLKGAGFTILGFSKELCSVRFAEVRISPTAFSLLYFPD